ncbi:uncharacterized protein LOC126662037 [Mercurialis annua]|uniref:uncharacterized protein LOC126662037 n=1 Tax=Mercurialis annua TaxID=3986 RepID=UPI00215E4917|nr:uncharacterized protein LOC126662037 [Mercurialis annua]
MATPKVSLKLIIDPKANKVLFAESEKDFVDFLCSLLCMPLGAAINLLKDAPTFGSLETLYNSIQNLKAVHMQPDHVNKDLLLKPRLPTHALGLTLCPSDATPQLLYLYRCPNYACRRNEVTGCKGKSCCMCTEAMDTPVTITDINGANYNVKNGFVKGDIKYMVMDDLSVLPITSIESFFDVLSNMNVKDVAALHKIVVEVRPNEVVELLKASLHSKEVLTNVLLLKPSIKGQKLNQ